MATRLTLIDNDGNAMECFLNQNNSFQINVATDSEEFLSTASISLNKDHIQKLLMMLTKSLNEINDCPPLNDVRPKIKHKLLGTFL